MSEIGGVYSLCGGSILREANETEGGCHAEDVVIFKGRDLASELLHMFGSEIGSVLTHK